MLFASEKQVPNSLFIDHPADGQQKACGDLSNRPPQAEGETYWSVQDTLSVVVTQA
jgi:hypothetical protein